MIPERHVRVEAIAWLAAIVPFVAANAAYLISASADLVPWCVPYLEGCASVSRAARTGIASPVFRGLMLPQAMILVLYWWLCAEWLRGFAPQRVVARRAILVLGVTSALFLILYATYLGVSGDFYQWMRRYGITLHFASTVLAQLLLTWVLVRDARLPEWIRHGKLGLCGAMLVLGLASIPLQHFMPGRESVTNALEWSYSVLMLAFFPLTGEAWRLSGFKLRLELDA